MDISSTSNTTLDLDDFGGLGTNTIEWVERECEECGEEYRTPRSLAAGFRVVCPDCSGPPAPTPDSLSTVGASLPDEPLMEFGPMSENRYSTE